MKREESKIRKGTPFVVNNPPANLSKLSNFTPDNRE